MWEYALYRNFRKEQNRHAQKWFEQKKYKVNKKYPYILAEREDWKQNIIPDGVADFIENIKNQSESIKAPFPLHKYIHHGLSSQAMLFNLLGDLVLQKNHVQMQELFSYPDVFINQESEMQFEHSNRKTFGEKSKQPTSFDLAILNKTGKNIFIEAKYVESEFGRCSAIENGECDGLNPENDHNLCYLTHKQRTYWEKMQTYNLAEPYKNSRICPLSIYYQFYRELIFALENNGYYLLLLDKRNPAFFRATGDNFDRGLIPILMKILPPEIADIIKVVFIQDVVRFLEPNNYSWLQDFKVKYGILF